jgi:hypothetical protein
MDGLSPAARTTELLARCVSRIGALTSVGSDDIRQLTVGDREALLLHLYRLAFGEAVPCVIDCPVTDCGERLETELHVADLLVEATVPACAQWVQKQVTADGASIGVRVRAASGADQERAVGIAKQGIDPAIIDVLDHCVEFGSISDKVEWSKATPALLESLSDALEALDPQAQLELSMICPACATHFVVVFDTPSYLFTRLAGSVHRLHQDIHLLALHYHWTERDIISMTTRSRGRYVEALVADLGMVVMP